MVVVCNIFEEVGVIFTNTFIILAFLIFTHIYLLSAVPSAHEQFCKKVVFVENC